MNKDSLIQALRTTSDKMGEKAEEVEADGIKEWSRDRKGSKRTLDFANVLLGHSAFAHFLADALDAQDKETDDAQSD